VTSAGTLAVHEPEPQQTYFKRGSLRNELDHVFVDDATARKVAEWRIDPLPATTLAFERSCPDLTERVARAGAHLVDGLARWPTPTSSSTCSRTAGPMGLS